MCIGTCEDGSVLIAHSTPSPSTEGEQGGGVQLSALGKSKSCEAYLLADSYMQKYFPEWYERYRPVLKDPVSYTSFTDCGGVFSWDLSENGILNDREGIRFMSASEILKLIFKE
jgi:hypothetical protein